MKAKITLSNSFFADFEVTYDQNIEEMDKTNYLELKTLSNQVYAWGICMDYSAFCKKQQDKRRYKIVGLKQMKGIKVYERVNNITIIGKCISSFFCVIDSININATVFFQNGARYDNFYLIRYLLEHRKKVPYRPIEFGIKNKEGFLKSNNLSLLLDKENIISLKERAKKLKLDNLKDVMFSYNDKWLDLLNEEFYISMLNSTSILYIRYKNKKGKLIEFRDYNLLFSGSLYSKGITLNKYYKKEIFSKGEIEHNITDKNFNIFENEKYLEYLKQDVLILLQHFKLMNTKLSSSLWKLTSASTSEDNWKNKFVGDIIEQYKDSFILVREHKDPTKCNYSINYKGAFHQEWKNNYYYNIWMYKKKVFTYLQIWSVVSKKYFPLEWLDKPSQYELPTIADKEVNVDKFIRTCYYQGAITYVNPLYQNKVIKKCRKLDVNSLYPYVMKMETHPMSPFKNNVVMAPIGKPRDISKLNSNKEYYRYYKIYTLSKMINKNGLPFINKKDVFVGVNRWCNEIDAYQTLYMDTYTLTAFKKFYKGKYTVKVLYAFEVLPISKVFKSYIGYWENIKTKASESKDIGLKNIAKLFLNSLYGKFALRPNRTVAIFINNKKYPIEYQNTPSRYLPIGALITNLARLKMVYDIGTKWRKYGVYIDTDSFTLKQGYGDFLEENDTEFGYYKDEIAKETNYRTKYCDFIAIRAKRYFYQIEGEKKTNVIASGYDESNCEILIDGKEKLFLDIQLEEATKNFIVKNQKTKILSNDLSIIIFEKEKEFNWELKGY